MACQVDYGTQGTKDADKPHTQIVENGAPQTLRPAIVGDSNHEGTGFVMVKWFVVVREVFVHSVGPS
jgi:hypothetical protein